MTARPSSTLSVIIPTLNAADVLPACLAAQTDIREVLIVDGGSNDATANIAGKFGARMIRASAGRGIQLDAAARTVPGKWLLFLHADTVLESGWRQEVERFISEPTNVQKVAVFRFSLDDASRAARRLEAVVGWRSRVLGLPYGDQGLLIHRDFYQALGGFPPWPLMEDVDLIRRIGRRRIVMLQSAARTSAAKWRRDGWIVRSLRNLGCLALYYLGLSPRLIQRLYG